MVPAMAQAMLLSLLGVVDLILIGSVMGATKEVINGTTAASFIVSFVLYSIAAITVSGNIYYGQFLKSKFYGKIRETTNFKILASTVVFLFFLALFYLVGQARLVKLVYNNPTAVKQGAFYMK